MAASATLGIDALLPTTDNDPHQWDWDIAELSPCFMAELLIPNTLDGSSPHESLRALLSRLLGRNAIRCSVEHAYMLYQHLSKDAISLEKIDQSQCEYLFQWLQVQLGDATIGRSAELAWCAMSLAHMCHRSHDFASRVPNELLQRLKDLLVDIESCTPVCYHFANALGWLCWERQCSGPPLPAEILVSLVKFAAHHSSSLCSDAASHPVVAMTMQLASRWSIQQAADIDVSELVLILANALERQQQQQHDFGSLGSWIFKALAASISRRADRLTKTTRQSTLHLAIQSIKQPRPSIEHLWALRLIDAATMTTDRSLRTRLCMVALPAMITLAIPKDRSLDSRRCIVAAIKAIRALCDGSNSALDTLNQCGGSVIVASLQLLAQVDPRFFVSHSTHRQLITLSEWCCCKATDLQLVGYRSWPASDIRSSFPHATETLGRGECLLRAPAQQALTCTASVLGLSSNESVTALSLAILNAVFDRSRDGPKFFDWMLRSDLLATAMQHRDHFSFLMRFILHHANIIELAGGASNIIRVYGALDRISGQYSIMVFVHEHVHREVFPTMLSGCVVHLLSRSGLGHPDRAGLSIQHLDQAWPEAIPCSRGECTDAAAALAHALVPHHTNLMATSCGLRWTGGVPCEHDETEALIVWVLLKGFIPIGESLFPSTFDFHERTYRVDVRDGYWEPLGDRQFNKRPTGSSSSSSPSSLSTLSFGILVNNAPFSRNTHEPLESVINMFYRDTTENPCRVPLGLCGVPVACVPTPPESWHRGTVGAYVTFGQPDARKYGHVTNAHVLQPRMSLVLDDFGSGSEQFAEFPYHRESLIEFSHSHGSTRLIRTLVIGSSSTELSRSSMSVVGGKLQTFCTSGTVCVCYRLDFPRIEAVGVEVRVSSKTHMVVEMSVRLGGSLLATSELAISGSGTEIQQIVWFSSKATKHACQQADSLHFSRIELEWNMSANQEVELHRVVLQLQPMGWPRQVQLLPASVLEPLKQEMEEQVSELEDALEDYAPGGRRSKSQLEKRLNEVKRTREMLKQIQPWTVGTGTRCSSTTSWCGTHQNLETHTQYVSRYHQVNVGADLGLTKERLPNAIQTVPAWSCRDSVAIEEHSSVSHGINVGMVPIDSLPPNETLEQCNIREWASDTFVERCGSLFDASHHQLQPGVHNVWKFGSATKRTDGTVVEHLMHLAVSDAVLASEDTPLDRFLLVATEPAQFTITTLSERFVLYRQIVVARKDPHNQFACPGDAGALVVRDLSSTPDRLVEAVGLLHGGFEPSVPQARRYGLVSDLNASLAFLSAATNSQVSIVGTRLD